MMNKSLFSYPLSPSPALSHRRTLSLSLLAFHFRFMSICLLAYLFLESFIKQALFYFNYFLQQFLICVFCSSLILYKMELLDWYLDFYEFSTDFIMSQLIFIANLGLLLVFLTLSFAFLWPRWTFWGPYPVYSAFNFQSPIDFYHRHFLLMAVTYIKHQYHPFNRKYHL